MQAHSEYEQVPVTKDSENQGPIPSAWRPILQNIVDAFVRHDYRLAKGVAGAAPVSEKTATQVAGFIQQYGATMVALPETTWNTSVCIWMGDHWDAMIDLWTEEEGRSDLVLQVRVSEVGSAYRVSVYMVYVP